MNYSRCHSREPQLGGGFLIPRTACPTLKQSQFSRSKAFLEFLNFKKAFQPLRDISGYRHSVAVLSLGIILQRLYSRGVLVGLRRVIAAAKGIKLLCFFPICFCINAKIMAFRLKTKEK